MLAPDLRPLTCLTAILAGAGTLLLGPDGH
jgi:hypothetical protein